MIAGVTHHLALRDVLHADALRGTDALIRHRTSTAPGARSAPDPAPAGVASGPPAPPGLPAPWSPSPDSAARPPPFPPADQEPPCPSHSDPKRVVSGKSASLSVDLGSPRRINK